MGNPYAQATWAAFLLDGIGTRAEPGQALIWAAKAADAGHSMAFAQLGWQYLNGLGVPQDMEQSRAWYLKGAENGDATSQYQLGWLYAHMDPTDYREAMKWYRSAAEQDPKAARDPEAIAKAQNNLGYMFEQGMGVQIDYHTAYGWYTQSAQSGYVRGVYHLGHLYADGLGVAQDLSMAHALMERASSLGDTDAAAWLATH